MAGSLNENGPDEVAVADEIAMPESCGVDAETEEPFHANALHPLGSASRLSRENIEGGADADGEFDGEGREVFLDPVLLFWGAEANDKEGGTGVLDSGEDGTGQFGRVFESQGRAVDAGDAEPEEAGFKVGGGGLRRADVATEKVGGDARLGGELAKVGGQFDAGDALGQGMLEQMAGEYQRHAVGDVDVGAFEQGFETRLLMGEVDKLRIDGGDDGRDGARTRQEIAR